jgi:hypothetical protein
MSLFDKEKPVTLLLDTEDGWLPVKAGIDAGTIVHRTINTYSKLEKALDELQRGKLDPMPDIIVIDTLSTFFTETRRALPYGRTPGISNDRWTNRTKLLSTQQDWGASADLTIDCLAEYRYLPMPTIFLAHEKLSTDSTTGEKRIGPALSPMLLEDVRNKSDAIWRMRVIDQPKSVEGVKYDKGTRFLRIQTSEDLFTKIRVDPRMSASLPDEIVRPTLRRVRDVVTEWFPKRLTVFGPSGAGKTVFGCSLSLVLPEDNLKPSLQKEK